MRHVIFQTVQQRQVHTFRVTRRQRVAPVAMLLIPSVPPRDSVYRAQVGPIEEDVLIKPGDRPTAPADVLMVSSIAA